MNSVQRKFVLDALDQPEVMTQWEIEFIDSLAELPEDRELSAKQNEILNRIQRKLD